MENTDIQDSDELPKTAEVKMPTFGARPQFNVTFDFYRGSEHVEETQVVLQNDSAIPPEGYDTRTGFDFVQWDKPLDNITESQTITAQYIEKVYTVSFNSNGGTAVGAQEVAYGGLVSKPADPSRTGYTFTNWYSDSGCTKVFDFTTPVAGDMILYAKWTIVKYDVTFVYKAEEEQTGGLPNKLVDKTTVVKVEHGSPVEPPADYLLDHWTFVTWDKSLNNITENQTITATYSINKYKVTFSYYIGETETTDVLEDNYGTEIAYPSAERTGYDLQYWMDGDEVAPTYLTKTFTATATYIQKSYTVTFRYHSGTSSEEKTQTSRVLYQEAAVPPTDVVWSGHTFKKWSGDYSSITSDCEFTAIYDDVMFTVMFNTVGGSEIASQTVASGQKITRPTDPTREGYAFVGWYTTSAYKTEFDFDTAITADITIYAKWDINVYDVTFDFYQGSEHKTEVKQVSHGGTVEVPSDYQRTGYNFVQWDKQRTNITSDQTITAEYEKKSYVVSFNTNGGTAIESQTVLFEDYATEPAATPTKTGHTFKGWYTDTTYTEVFDFGEKITGDTTVYAWMDPFKYTMTFETDGGSSVPSQTINYGEKPSVPESPHKTNLTFSGWYTTNTYAEKFNFDLPIYGDTVAYAKWTEVVLKLAKALGNVSGSEYLLDAQDGRYALKMVDEIPDAPTESDTYAIQLSQTVGENKKGDIFIWKNEAWTKVSTPTETVHSVSNIVCPRVGQDVQIRWYDPEDRDPYTWKHTRLLRKYGEFPTSIYDGVIVTDSFVRDQYSKTTFHDFVPAGTEDNWYYRFYTFSEDEVPYSADADTFRPIELSWENLSAIVQSGLASRVFAIGDAVTVGPNDDYKDDAFYKDMELSFVVVAFNQATPTDTSKTYSITFAAANSLSNYPTRWDNQWPEYMLTSDTYVITKTKQYYIREESAEAGIRYVPVSLPLGKRLTPNTYYEKKESEADLERRDHGGNRWASSAFRSWLNSTDPTNKWTFYNGTTEIQAVPPLVALQTDFTSAVTSTKNTNALPVGSDRVASDYEMSYDLLYLLSMTEVFGENALYIRYKITSDSTPKQYVVTADTERNLFKNYFVYSTSLLVYRKAEDADYNEDGSFKEGTTYYDLNYYVADEEDPTTYRMALSMIDESMSDFTAANEFKDGVTYYNKIVSDIAENPKIPYYEDTALEPRIGHDSGGNPVTWWLRSANIFTATKVRYSDKSGELQEGDASYDGRHHILFGFSIS